jgi:hypothetical protein
MIKILQDEKYLLAIYKINASEYLQQSHQIIGYILVHTS